MSRRRLTRCARAAAVVVAGALTLVGCGPGGDTAVVKREAATTAADFSYVIPEGTGDRIDRGEPVDIIPADIAARVGQVIRIVNEDTRGHLVGPFFVGRGETLTQRFSAPGTLRGACSVHPSGTITVTVRA